MACQCADGWQTTKIAASRELSWHVAVQQDNELVAQFLARGGSGSRSIDKFVQNDLLLYAGERYTSTSFLIDNSGRPVGFVSNAMASVDVPSSELMGRNMPVIPEIPLLFLHRLGVIESQQRKGLGSLLTWRVFETLEHSCVNSAAAGIALLVEANNARAKRFYQEMSFACVDTRGKYELLILQYETAVQQILALSETNPPAAPGLV